MKKGTQPSGNIFFTINEKKDLGLLKKVQKQERLSLSRHEHSISVQGMNIQFQCLILHP